MKEILLFAILSISFASFASDIDLAVEGFWARQKRNSPLAKVSCVCQMGQQPFIQKWFFKKGCEIWLDEQTGCDEKRILNEDSYTKMGYKGIDLEPQFQNGFLKLGYVGHWGANLESYTYFTTVLVPTMEKYKVSILWDNSGCSGLSSPAAVLDLSYMQTDLDFRLKKIGYDHQLAILKIDLQYKKLSRADENTINSILQKIEDLLKNPPVPPPTYPVLFRAVQVKSIGIWDRKFNQKSNLWSMVDFQKKEIIYPACKEFEGQSCTSAYQGGESGKCLNPDRGLETIICCEQENNFQVEDARANSNAQWKLKRDCRN